MKGDDDVLLELGIVRGGTKTYEIFNESISDNFLNIPEMSSSEYVRYCWGKYETFRSENPQDNSMNGNIFEVIIITELYRQALLPMFLQAKVAFVPNVNFDVLLYSSDQFPVGISVKTSLRERYKQADLEAIALKYVHRRALNYLITLDLREAFVAKTRLEKGDLLGINKIVCADTEEFDILIAELLEMEFIKPEKIDVVKGNIVDGMETF